MNQTEPSIIINGAVLTEAQSTAVRMAVTTLLYQMAEADALGDDEHGIKMAAAYRARLTEVIRLMVA